MEFNWKYILIVVILAALVGGVLIWQLAKYYQYFSKSIPYQPPFSIDGFVRHYSFNKIAQFADKSVKVDPTIYLSTDDEIRKAILAAQVKDNALTREALENTNFTDVLNEISSKCVDKIVPLLHAFPGYKYTRMDVRLGWHHPIDKPGVPPNTPIISLDIHGLGDGVDESYRILLYFTEANRDCEIASAVKRSTDPPVAMRNYALYLALENLTVRERLMAKNHYVNTISIDRDYLVFFRDQEVLQDLLKLTPAIIVFYFDDADCNHFLVYVDIFKKRVVVTEQWYVCPVQPRK